MRCYRSPFTLFILLSGLAAAPAVAQEGPGVVVWENAPLDRVLSEFSSMSGLELVYAVKTVRNVRISGRYVRGEDPRAQLDRILKGTGIRAQRIREGQYVLINEPISLEVLGDDPRLYTGTMEGRVVDASTGAPLFGANVLLVDLGLGDAAAADGRFSIPNLPTGTYVVRVSHVGYRPVRLEQTVYPASPRRPPEIRLRPVILHADGEALVTQGPEPLAPPPGSVDFDADQATVIPFALAEPDLAATLDWLPGVSRTGGAYGALVVRGASPDMSRAFRNGVPIYDGLHLLGMVSPFQPEGLSRVRFYRGMMPASVGGGTSGVLQVESRDGFVERFTGLAGVDPITVRALGQIPVTPSLGVFASVRRSTVGAILQPRVSGQLGGTPVVQPVGSPAWLPDPSPDLSFFDAEGRVTARLSKSARLDVDGYFGADSFGASDDDEVAGTTWGSHALSARIQTLAGERTLINALAYDTRSHFAGDSITSSIREDALRIEAEHFFGVEHQVQAGVMLVHRSVAGRFETNRLEAGGYAQWAWKPLDGLEIQPGIRIEAPIGGTGSLSPSDVQVSPRLGIRWTVQRDHLIFRAGGGRLTQAVHRLRSAVPGPLARPFASWILPGYSHAWIVGAGMEWAPLEPLAFSVDVYRRNSFDEPARESAEPPGAIEEEIGGDETRAAGVEVAARYQTGPWTFGVSYAFSRTERKNSLAGPLAWERGMYDRPHALRFLIERRKNDLGASLRLDVESGVPDARGGRTPTDLRLSLALGTHFEAFGIDWEGSIRALTRPFSGTEHPFADHAIPGLLADLRSTPALPLLALTAHW